MDVGMAVRSRDIVDGRMTGRYVGFMPVPSLNMFFCLHVPSTVLLYTFSYVEKIMVNTKYGHGVHHINVSLEVSSNVNNVD